MSKNGDQEEARLLPDIIRSGNHGIRAPKQREVYRKVQLLHVLYFLFGYSQGSSTYEVVNREWCTVFLRLAKPKTLFRVNRQPCFR
jgi:hypothetical protein